MNRLDPRRIWSCTFLALLCGFALGLYGQPALAVNPVVSSWETDLSYENPTYNGNVFHELVVDGDVVHTMWVSHSPSPNETAATVYYRRSIDSGVTWEPTVTIASFSGTEAYYPDWKYKCLAVENGRVYIFHSVRWTDNGQWGGYLSVSTSTDNGATFAPPKTIHPGGIFYTVSGQVAVAESGLVSISVSVKVPVESSSDISFLILSSTDGGDTWTTTTAFTLTKGPDGYDIDDYLRIGNNIFLLYHYPSENNLYLQMLVSNDNGQTFFDKRLTIPNKDNVHKVGTLQAYNYVPKIAADGDNVAVVLNCQDDQDNTPTVYLRASQDKGQTFGNAVALSRQDAANLAIVQGVETLAMKGNHLYAVFRDLGNLVYFQPATAAGIPVGSLQTLTTQVVGSNIGWWPVTAVSPADATGTTAYVDFDGSCLAVTTDGGQTVTFPAMIGTNTYKTTTRPRLVVDDSGVIHTIAQKLYYSDSLCSGYCKDDIFYRRLPPAPPPGKVNRSLQVQNDISPPIFELGVAGLAQVASNAINTLSSPLTIEAWVQPLPGNTGGSGSRQPILFKLTQYGIAGEGHFPFAMGLEMDGTSRKVYAHLQNLNSALDAWLSPTTANAVAPDNTWTHMAFTFDRIASDNNFKLYCNGTLVAATRVTSAFDPTPGYLMVGGFGNMRIDEVRIWNTARTAQQIQADKNRALNGNEPGLVAYYPFNDTTRDATGHGNEALFMYQETYTAGVPLVQGVSPATFGLLLLH